MERNQEKPLSGIVLVIAEDVPTSRMILTRLLSSAGAEVHAASNGAEALSLIERTPNISAVLMDIQMPIMDGVEATKILRERQYQQPIIAVTAASEIESREFAALGFTDYLPKPVFAKNLIVKIQSALMAQGAQSSIETSQLYA